MKILCYGDSNTWGYVPNINGYSKGAVMRRYSDKECWWGALCEGNEVVVDGLCGRCIANESRWLINRNASVTLDKDFCKHTDIDCVIVQLGTNDCKSEYNLTAENIAKNMQKLIQKIKCKNIEKIILISPAVIRENNNITKKYYVGAGVKSEKLDDLYAQIAQNEGCEFVSAKDIEVGEDGEHLTKYGHKMLSDRVCAKINEYSNIMECNR